MVLIVFGIILLVMTLVAGKFMKKEATNPNCSEDVNDVKANKRNYKIGLWASGIMIILGLVIEFLV